MNLHDVFFLFSAKGGVVDLHLVRNVPYVMDKKFLIELYIKLLPSVDFFQF
jgi:hypothetical protein